MYGVSKCRVSADKCEREMSAPHGPNDVTYRDRTRDRPTNMQPNALNNNPATPNHSFNIVSWMDDGFITLILY